MSPLFFAALAASGAAASSQHYPQATLYVVATPIGNLADISLRALHVLGLVDVVACEDTRHTQALLRAYGIDKSAAQLLALHQHNETQGARALVDLLRLGRRVAYVSDAGTPGISDPGGRLVAAVRAAGLRSLPIPGASSVTTLLSVAGVAQEQPGGFEFMGFLPTKAAERAHAVQALTTLQRAAVVLEAPHRIESLALALSCLGQRRVTLGRELTKQFEEIATLPAEEIATWLAQDSNRLRGEFSLVIHPAEGHTEPATDTRVLKLLLEHLPLKTAVKLAGEITGESRNTLYQAALDLKQSH
ncbi:MAG: 16S rRNA (cytidine(1402)-2'-O)-methyltransferase [Rhodoferax sp.]|nr:16S rRNA (cytidine(1402)-2'-O)-methyltransferase [Rhodoferax sp.]